RSAIAAQKILEHVRRNVLAALDLMQKIFPYDFARECRVELAVERIQVHEISTYSKVALRRTSDAYALPRIVASTTRTSAASPSKSGFSAIGTCTCSLAVRVTRPVCGSRAAQSAASPTTSVVPGMNACIRAGIDGRTMLEYEI